MNCRVSVVPILAILALSCTSSSSSSSSSVVDAAWTVPFVSFSSHSVSSSSGSSRRRSSSSSTSLNASRRSVKKQRRVAWVEKRGFTRDGTPLEASAMTPTTTTIVGSGRIGSLFQEAFDDDNDCIVVGREDSIDPDGSGPIIVTTRNDALDGIVEKCPEHRRKDLVFVQNGYLDHFLKEKGLMDNTQVLLFLSVPKLGVTPVDGITKVNPEGLTSATGEHATAFAHMLDKLHLKCNVLTPEEYRPAMFEKLIWIATYMLVGTAKECSSVGQAGTDFGDVVESVVSELVKAVETQEGIVFTDGVMDRLASYTEVVADFPCGVKEFEWRNEYFYQLIQKKKADGDDDEEEEEACPIHNGLLRECAEKGLIGFNLP